MSVAKVCRDRMTENWQYSEPLLQDACKRFGSGYPSDPTCKEWLERNMHCPIFGYADVIRFSWKPTKLLLEKHAKMVKFEADEDEQDEVAESATQKQREQMKSFFALDKEDDSSANRKRKQYPYMTKRKLAPVYKLL
jgi:hypothetical protein